ncbi:MAG: SO_0444 family Cu/Zn efflux transporter [Chitinispirillia bacterium]|jgi:uncharacterized membrane protein YraQ (UPF0718 family)/copper chaperone CopZ
MNEKIISTINGLFVEIVITFNSMAPYLLLGLAFAGILHVLFKKEFISKHLGDNGIMSSVKASIFGIPLPLCSCGVIPTAFSLRKSKASDVATLSFLISTPQTGVDSIIATYGMLGPVFAVFRPFAALVMGILGGISTSLISFKTKKDRSVDPDDLHNESLSDEPAENRPNLIEKINIMIKYAFGTFLDDISIQLVVGIIISGIIAFFIPDDFFVRYVGGGIVGMLLMIIAGIPLYVCATASIPIAATLMMKGLSPGAAFVFLVAGPATNAATVTLITNVMGKAIAVLYLSVISTGALVFGYLLNFIYSFFKIDPAMHVMKHHHKEPSVFITLFSIALLIMLILSFFRKFRAGFSHNNSKNEKRYKGNTGIYTEDHSTTLSILGMTCNHCANHVKEAIQSVRGVTKVDVFLQKKNAVIRGDFSLDDVKTAVKNAGYGIS